MREVRTLPYSRDELRAMLADGDTVSQIYARARRFDSAMGKNTLREILFGSPR